MTSKRNQMDCFLGDEEDGPDTADTFGSSELRHEEAEEISRSIATSLRFWGQLRDSSGIIAANRLKTPLERRSKAAEMAELIWEKLGPDEVEWLRLVEGTLMCDGEIKLEQLFEALERISVGVGFNFQDVFPESDEDDIQDNAVNLMNQLLFTLNQNPPPGISAAGEDDGIGYNPSEGSIDQEVVQEKMEQLLQRAYRHGIQDLRVPSSPHLSDQSKLRLMEKQVNAKIRHKKIHEIIGNQNFTKPEKLKEKKTMSNIRRQLNKTENKPTFRTAVKPQQLAMDVVIQHAQRRLKNRKRISESQSPNPSQPEKLVDTEFHPEEREVITELIETMKNSFETGGLRSGSACKCPETSKTIGLSFLHDRKNIHPSSDVSSNVLPMLHFRKSPQQKSLSFSSFAGSPRPNSHEGKPRGARCYLDFNRNIVENSENSGPPTEGEQLSYANSRGFSRGDQTDSPRTMRPSSRGMLLKEMKTLLREAMKEVGSSIRRQASVSQSVTVTENVLTQELEAQTSEHMMTTCAQTSQHALRTENIGQPLELKSEDEGAIEESMKVDICRLVNDGDDLLDIRVTQDSVSPLLWPLARDQDRTVTTEISLSQLNPGPAVKVSIVNKVSSEEEGLSRLARDQPERLQEAVSYLSELLDNQDVQRNIKRSLENGVDIPSEINENSETSNKQPIDSDLTQYNNIAPTSMSEESSTITPSTIIYQNVYQTLEMVNDLKTNTDSNNYNASSTKVLNESNDFMVPKNYSEFKNLVLKEEKEGLIGISEPKMGFVFSDYSNVNEALPNGTSVQEENTNAIVENDNMLNMTVDKQNPNQFSSYDDMHEKLNHGKSNGSNFEPLSSGTFSVKVSSLKSEKSEMFIQASKGVSSKTVEPNGNFMESAMTMVHLEMKDSQNLSIPLGQYKRDLSREMFENIMNMSDQKEKPESIYIKEGLTDITTRNEQPSSLLIEMQDSFFNDDATEGNKSSNSMKCKCEKYERKTKRFSTETIRSSDDYSAEKQFSIVSNESNVNETTTVNEKQFSMKSNESNIRTPAGIKEELSLIESSIVSNESNIRTLIQEEGSQTESSLASNESSIRTPAGLKEELSLIESSIVSNESNIRTLIQEEGSQTESSMASNESNIRTPAGLKEELSLIESSIVSNESNIRTLIQEEYSHTESSMVSNESNIRTPVVIKEEDNKTESSMVSSESNMRTPAVMKEEVIKKESSIASNESNIRKATLIQEEDSNTKSSIVSSESNIRSPAVIKREDIKKESSIMSNESNIRKATLIQEEDSKTESSVVSSESNIESSAVIKGEDIKKESSIMSNESNIRKATLIQEEDSNTESSIVSSESNIRSSAVIKGEDIKKESSFVSNESNIRRATLIYEEVWRTESSMLSSQSNIRTPTVIQDEDSNKESSMVSNKFNITEPTAIKDDEISENKFSMVSSESNIRKPTVIQDEDSKYESSIASNESNFGKPTANKEDVSEIESSLVNNDDSKIEESNLLQRENGEKESSDVSIEYNIIMKENVKEEADKIKSEISPSLRESSEILSSDEVQQISDGLKMSTINKKNFNDEITGNMGHSTETVKTSIKIKSNTNVEKMKVLTFKQEPDYVTLETNTESTDDSRDSSLYETLNLRESSIADEIIDIMEMSGMYNTLELRESSMHSDVSKARSGLTYSSAESSETHLPVGIQPLGNIEDEGGNPQDACTAAGMFDGREAPSSASLYPQEHDVRSTILLMPPGCLRGERLFHLMMGRDPPYFTEDIGDVGRTLFAVGGEGWPGQIWLESLPPEAFSADSADSLYVNTEEGRTGQDLSTSSQEEGQSAPVPAEESNSSAATTDLEPNAHQKDPVRSSFLSSSEEALSSSELLPINHTKKSSRPSGGLPQERPSADPSSPASSSLGLLTEGHRTSESQRPPAIGPDDLEETPLNTEASREFSKNSVLQSDGSKKGVSEFSSERLETLNSREESDSISDDHISLWIDQAKNHTLTKNNYPIEIRDNNSENGTINRKESSETIVNVSKIGSNSARVLIQVTDPAQTSDKDNKTNIVKKKISSKILEDVLVEENSVTVVSEQVTRQNDDEFEMITLQTEQIEPILKDACERMNVQNPNSNNENIQMCDNSTEVEENLVYPRPRSRNKMLCLSHHSEPAISDVKRAKHSVFGNEENNDVPNESEACSSNLWPISFPQKEVSPDVKECMTESFEPKTSGEVSIRITSIIDQLGASSSQEPLDLASLLKEPPEVDLSLALPVNRGYHLPLRKRLLTTFRILFAGICLLTRRFAFIATGPYKAVLRKLWTSLFGGGGTDVEERTGDTG